MYSGGFHFKSLPGDGLSWLGCFVVFHGVSKYSTKVHRLVRENLLLNHFLVIIQQSFYRVPGLSSKTLTRKWTLSYPCHRIQNHHTPPTLTKPHSTSYCVTILHWIPFHFTSSLLTEFHFTQCWFKIPLQNNSGMKHTDVKRAKYTRLRASWYGGKLFKCRMKCGCFHWLLVIFFLSSTQM
jgi:hypothetical protein